MLIALLFALSSSSTPADACGELAAPRAPAVALASKDLADAEYTLEAAQARRVAAGEGEVVAAEQAVWEAELGLEQARRVAAMVAESAS
jgi:hypothetical protein